MNDDYEPVPIPPLDCYPDPADEQTAPSGLCVIVAFNDGRFETYEPALDSHYWQVMHKARKRYGAFVEAEFGSGAWRGVPTPKRLRSRVVLVYGGCSWDADEYAADLAARLSGHEKMLKARLERAADGFFHCPHCTSLYKSATPFSGHLRRDCKDQGAARYTQTGEFVERNGRLARPRPEHREAA